MGRPFCQWSDDGSRFPQCYISALYFIQCLNTVGWVYRKDIQPTINLLQRRSFETAVGRKYRVEASPVNPDSVEQLVARHCGVDGKRKKERKRIYIAPFIYYVYLKSLRHESHSFTCKYTMPAFPLYAFTRWRHL